MEQLLCGLLSSVEEDLTIVFLCDIVVKMQVILAVQKCPSLCSAGQPINWMINVANPEKLVTSNQLCDVKKRSAIFLISRKCLLPDVCLRAKRSKQVNGSCVNLVARFILTPIMIYVNKLQRGCCSPL